MTGHSLTSVATPFTGSVAPYYNGTLSDSSRFSSRSIEPIADFIAQDIYTERKQEFVIALSKLLPTAASTAKISPLVRFLNTQLDELGGLEKVKTALYKPQGYFSRLLGKESWMEWSEDRTDLGYVVSNMAGILSTGPGRSVEEFVATLDAQRLINADKEAEVFLETIKPVAVSPKQKLGKRDIAHNHTAEVDAQNAEVDLPIISRRDANTPQKLGPEFSVNTYKLDAQIDPSITRLSNTRFVETWTSFGKDSLSFGVCGQTFDSSGVVSNPSGISAAPQKSGVEFQLKGYIKDNQIWTVINYSWLTDSRFVVTWGRKSVGDCELPPCSTYLISSYSQVFDANGSAPIKIGSAFQLKGSPSRLTDNRFISIWVSDTQIYGQLFDMSGSVPVQWGPEFQLNTYATGSKYNPTITALTGNRFVATWTSDGQDGPLNFGHNYGVYGQVFDTSGGAPIKWGPEFQVNTYTSTNQDSSKTIRLTDNLFVAVWVSDYQDGSYSGVYGQVFDTSGGAPVKVGLEFQVNSYTINAQGSPSIARLTDGRFVVTWSSEEQDGSSSGVYGQVFDVKSSTPTRRGSQFQVNTYTQNSQDNAHVTGLSDSRFVVAWTSLDQDGPGKSIYSQIFELANIPDPTTTISTSIITTARPSTITSAKPSSSATTKTITPTSRTTTTVTPASSASPLLSGVSCVKPVGNQFNLFGPFADSAPIGAVSMALAQDGKVMATASKFYLDAEKSDVYSQWIQADGVSAPQLSGPSLMVNTFAAKEQGYASTAALGNITAAVWSSLNQDGSSYGIYAQLYRLNSAGLPEKFGVEFPVNSYKNNAQTAPSIAIFPGNRLLITWLSQGQDGDGLGVFAQAFQIDASGAAIKLGNEFQVNTDIFKDQWYQTVTALSDDLALVHWTSDSKYGEQLIDGFKYFVGRRLCAQVIKLSSTGTPAFVGHEFQTDSYSDQIDSSATYLGNGQFILTWTNGDIYAKLFKVFSDKTPEAIGDEFLVNTNKRGSQGGAFVVPLENGFVITWDSEEGDNSGWGIDGQLFGLQNGQAPIKMGSPFQVNAETQGSQDYSMAIPITNNSFLVAWESNPSISSSIANKISAQLFNISTNCSTTDDNPSNTSNGYSKGLPGLLGIIPVGLLLWWCCKSAKCDNSVSPEEGAENLASRISEITDRLRVLKESNNIEPGAQWFGSSSAPQAEANTLGKELRRLRYGKGCSIM